MKKPKPITETIDQAIASRRDFRLWWQELVWRIPGYGSPEHEAIAWSAWSAGRNVKVGRTRETCWVIVTSQVGKAEVEA